MKNHYLRPPNRGDSGKMIDQATVDKIIDAANILDVVSDFVTLRKRGVNYVGLCPFHNEKTPSFSVSPAKGICKCFSCGKGGSAVYFIMEHEQLSYYEALKYLAKKYNIEVKERELTDEEKKAQSNRESMLILNNFAQEFFTRTLFDHPEGQAVGLSYFHERGFRDDIIRKFMLGYSPEQRDALAQEAQKAGYNKDFLLKTGLCLENQAGQLNDRFRGRVIFPVLGLSGKVLAFGGRVLKKTDKTAKYVNSPESDIYHKSNELYGIFQAKQAIVKNDCCFLVEGYTDVLSMHQAGIENVVASSGTSLTPGQIRLIHRFTNNITVLYDGDAAGIKASLRGIDLILKEGLNIKVVLLPDGDDPDSFSKKQSAASFTGYIKEQETDFIRFKTNLLLESAGNDPIKRAELISDIVQTIAIIPDAIVRSVYTKECSQLMEIEEQVLIREINRQKLHQLESERSPVQGRPVAGDGAGSAKEAEKADGAPETEERKATAPQSGSVSPCEPYERALIRYIIRYADIELFNIKDEETGDETSWNVLSYIVNDLRQDEIEFTCPLYNRILEAAITHTQQNGNCPERFFVTHPDPEIGNLAADLISEKYQLSKIHTKYQQVETEQERIADLVPRALFELKDFIIKQQIARLNAEIKNAGQMHDTTEHIQEKMKKIAELIRLRSILAKEIGDRILYPK